MRISAQANRTLLIKLVAAATTYAFTILLARTMTPAGFGQIAIFLNLALVLSVVGARGQHTAALRFLPPLAAKADHGARVGFVNRSLQIAGTGTLLVSLIALGLALISKSQGGMPGYSVALLCLGLALVPIVAWSDLQSHFARGLGFLQLSLVPKEIIWRALAALVVVAVYMAQGQQRLDALLITTVLILTLVLVTFFQAVILSHRTKQLGDHQPKTPDHMRKEWRNASGSFWVTSVSNVFLTNMDVVFVGIFAGSKAAGIYFAANRLATFLGFFRASYNVVLAPNLAAAWRNGTPGQVEEIIHIATRKMTLPTVVLGIAMAVLAPQILTLFGDGFSDAALPLSILLLAGVLNSCLGPADIALNMCGYQRQAMQISAIALIFSTGLLALGAAYAGGTGIALAVLLATVLRKLLFWQKARQKLAIRCDILAALRAVRPLKVANPT